MRIAILWTGLSGYFGALLRQIINSKNVHLMVIYRIDSDNAPFDESLFGWIPHKYSWANKCSSKDLIEILNEFSPDVIICANWHNRAYRKALSCFKGKAIRIFTSDHPWVGSFRQICGVLISRFYLRSISEAIWVPGERQRFFASLLGYEFSKIIIGLYTCDFETFAVTFKMRKRFNCQPKAFIFIGRLVKEKGIVTLLNAYEQYRRSTPNPWPLRIYGCGPLEHIASNYMGVEIKGFVQPNLLCKEFLDASCLVVPSNYEPWGVVVHEAVSAGLSVISSDAVGSHPHLVRDEFNGYIFQARDSDGLAICLSKFANLSDSEIKQMSLNSFSLARQFTPERSARKLLESCHNLLSNFSKLH